MARREKGESGYLTDEQRSHAGWIGASKYSGPQKRDSVLRCVFKKKEARNG
jgi:hypothetical protein